MDKHGISEHLLAQACFGSPYPSFVSLGAHIACGCETTAEACEVLPVKLQKVG